MTARSVFVTGGTGYIGQPLLRALVDRGHQMRALVRTGSESKLPAGCEPISGNALDATSYADRVAPSHTFVQLVGVAHPSPAKALEFQAIDRASALGAIAAAKNAGIQHFVYLSVAQPAPVMKSYIAIRAECEAALHAAGMNVTIVRPWYVLGPGHRWPYALLPMYWLFERIPSTRDGARRLGLVTLPQMTRSLVSAIENPCIGARILESHRFVLVSQAPELLGTRAGRWNYESACTWDIFLPALGGEMLNRRRKSEWQIRNISTMFMCAFCE